MSKFVVGDEVVFKSGHTQPELITFLARGFSEGVVYTVSYVDGKDVTLNNDNKTNQTAHQKNLKLAKKFKVGDAFVFKSGRTENNKHWAVDFLEKVVYRVIEVRENGDICAHNEYNTRQVIYQKDVKRV